MEKIEIFRILMLVHWIALLKGKLINAGKWDHFGISNKAYDALKSFDQTAKVIKVSGKTLLITGIIADTISLGKAIESDLKDADRKLGKTTSIEITES